MSDKRKMWIERLNEIREEEYLSAHEQAEEIGIGYQTYKKVIDPVIPPLSYSVLRKVRDYVEGKEE